jgi:hypothetical protein
MEWSDVADIIKKAAPAAEGLLATFGGPPGMIAAGAIKAATMAFGLDEKAKPDELAAAIAADPQAALKLKQAEFDYQIKKRDQDIDELRVQLADVQNARGRQTDHERVTGKSDTNLYVLAWVIMGGFIGSIIGLIIMATVYPTVNLNNPLLNILFGSLSTDAGMVVGYFFGSSRGSDSKTDLLARAEPVK